MKLNKFKNLDRFNEIEDIVLGKKIYLSKISELNDPNEKYFNQKRLPIGTWENLDCIKFLDTLDARLFCLSSDENNLNNKRKMWKNYASEEMGVCIVFEYDAEGFKFPIFPIRYVTEQEFQNLINDQKDVNFVKEDKWAYEMEYRFAISGDPITLKSQNYRSFDALSLSIREILYKKKTEEHSNFIKLKKLCIKENIVFTRT